MAKPRRTPSPFADRDNCVNRSNHTPQPSGYSARIDWSDRMAQTHTQELCPGCGYYMIWVPKEKE